LYQIIGKRHRDDLPTIFTSNIQQIGQCIAWRIMEMYGENIINMQDANQRNRRLRHTNK